MVGFPAGLAYTNPALASVRVVGFYGRQSACLASDEVYAWLASRLRTPGWKQVTDNLAGKALETESLLYLV